MANFITSDISKHGTPVNLDRIMGINLILSYPLCFNRHCIQFLLLSEDECDIWQFESKEDAERIYKEVIKVGNFTTDDRESNCPVNINLASSVSKEFVESKNIFYIWFFFSSDENNILWQFDSRTEAEKVYEKISKDFKLIN